MHDELRVEHSTQVFHSQRFRWRLWVPLSLFRQWLWSFSRSLHCRSTGSLIHFCKKTKYSALALTTGLTIYHRRLFAKSTPHGDVAFQTCTRVELRHLEVETAAVSICDPTAFAFARAKLQTLKGWEECETGPWLDFLHAVLLWDLCLVDLLREFLVVLIWTWRFIHCLLVLAHYRYIDIGQYETVICVIYKWSKFYCFSSLMSF